MPLIGRRGRHVLIHDMHVVPFLNVIYMARLSIAYCFIAWSGPSAWTVSRATYCSKIHRPLMKRKCLFFYYGITAHLVGIKCFFLFPRIYRHNWNQKKTILKFWKTTWTKVTMKWNLDRYWTNFVVLWNKISFIERSVFKKKIIFLISSHTCFYSYSSQDQLQERDQIM